MENVPPISLIAIILSLHNRYIRDLPEKQLVCYRLWTHYKRAYYDYIDNILTPELKLDPNYPATYRKFLNHIVPLNTTKDQLTPGKLIYHQRNPKNNLNFYGCILISSDYKKTLCVQTKKLSFPKSYKNFVDQSKNECSLRALYEQTGIDYRDQAEKLTNQEIWVSQKKQRYIVFYNVSEEIELRPKSKYYKPKWVGIEKIFYNYEDQCEEGCRLAGRKVVSLNEHKVDWHKIGIYLKGFHSKKGNIGK